MYFHCAALAGLIACCLSTLVSHAESSAPRDEVHGESEELIVVASRLPTKDYKIGSAVSVLDRADIERIGYQHAADLLRFIPGIAVSRTGGFGGTTHLRMRGAEDNHAIVLIDGIDAADAGSGLFDLSSLLTTDIERIEVLRGPQSGLHGSNALAGVVNIRTRAPEQGYRVSTEIEGGSFATRHGAISVSGGSTTTNGRLSYTDRRTEFDISRDDSAGREKDTDHNKTLTGRMHYRPSDLLSFDILGRHTDKETDTDGFDFSGGAAQGLPTDDTSFANTVDQTFGAAATLALVDGRWRSRVAFELADSEVDGGNFGSNSTRDRVSLDTSWQWQPTARSAQRSTLFFERDEETFQNAHPFDPSQAPRQERDLSGFGIEHRFELDDALFVSATIRKDRNDNFEDATTYSLAGSIRLGDHNRLHASYGTAVTNPTFFEQFGFVPGTFVGNPNLDPEKSTGWDLGLERTFWAETLIVDVTYFDANLENEIQSIFPSVGNAPGESTRDGFELSASYRATPSTVISGSYTYTDAVEPAGVETRRPKHMGTLALSHRFLSNRASVAGSVRYNGDMLDNDFRNFFTNGFLPERTQLGSYVVVGFIATYRITESVEAYVRVENALDEDYEEVIGYATPGRAAFAGIRFDLAD